MACCKTPGRVFGSRWSLLNTNPACLGILVKRTPSGQFCRQSTVSTSPNSTPGAPESIHISDTAQAANHSPRVHALKSAKPFSAFLTDTFNRQHDYLRISITEKCNLRCLYCMPEEGVPLSPKKHLLTPQEILYLSSIFVSQGVTKIRLTGGEPTIHPQFLPLLHEIGGLRQNGLRELALTTNGLTLFRKLDSVAEAGVTGINLSLDTLDPFQFEIMTRRRGFDQVMKSIDRILAMNQMGASIRLKVNVVVIRGLNDAQIIPFVEMTKEKNLEVRFIEYMPFDGNKWSSGKMIAYQEMLDMIKERYPELQKVEDHPNDTSKTFQIPGFQGRLGFISSMTDHFCGSCNRLRLTSDGNLKVCLFGNSEVSLRDMLRGSFNHGEPIDESAWEAMRHIEMDRRQGKSEGELGYREKEMELLDIIGTAVKRKKAKHAGIGILEHMKNRPMILIDHLPPYAATTAANAGAPPAGKIPPSRSSFPRKHSASSHGVPFTSSHRYPGLVLLNDAHMPKLSISAFSTHAADCKEADPFNSSAEYESSTPSLSHLTSKGEAHMVNLPPPTSSSSAKAEDGTDFKPITTRVATATAFVIFSNSEPYCLISPSIGRNFSESYGKGLLPKGDVIAVSRIAGIMAAKKTPDLIPLCHNIPLAGVNVDVQMIDPDRNIKDGKVESAPGTVGNCHAATSTANSIVNAPFGAIRIDATVKTHGQTGVEMEALTAASMAALTVYDMCKAVDRNMSIQQLKVTFKTGGRSGEWRDGVKVN